MSATQTLLDASEEGEAILLEQRWRFDRLAIL